MGPLTMTAVPLGWVVIAAWKKRYSGSAIASIAAMTIGKYSGRQPASTALTASLSTVIAAPLGVGPASSTASGGRVTLPSMAATRSGVGATTGSPSVICSASSSCQTRWSRPSVAPPGRSTTSSGLVAAGSPEPPPRACALGRADGVVRPAMVARAVAARDAASASALRPRRAGASTMGRPGAWYAAIVSASPLPSAVQIRTQGIRCRSSSPARTVEGP